MREDDDIEAKYLTQTEHDALAQEVNTASLDRCKEIAHMLLGMIIPTGYARYDPEYGDDRICCCGHEYHRHFDSYENMCPSTCKYCHCRCFVEKGDTKKWKDLNLEC